MRGPPAVPEARPAPRAGGGAAAAHKQRARVRLRARQMKPAFLPAPLQPHLLIPLTGVPAPIPVPGAPRRAAAAPVAPGALSARQGRCRGRCGAECGIQQVGAGRGRGPAGERARPAAPAGPFTAPPAGQTPPEPAPELGNAARPRERLRAALGCQVQDGTRNFPRFCCQAVLKQATSQKRPQIV